MPHKMEDEELSNLYEDLKVVLESLQDVEEYFSCILHDLNTLILLFYLTYSFTDLTESNATYSDLYHTVCEFLTGELDETEAGSLSGYTERTVGTGCRTCYRQSKRHRQRRI